MCPKSCFALEYTGYVDYIGEKGSFYNPRTNGTYFSLSIRYKTPALATLHEEYTIIDSYGMVGVVGGTLGIFIGFSFIEVITFLMTFFQKAHDEINKRNPIDKITQSKTTIVKECPDSFRRNY